MSLLMQNEYAIHVNSKNDANGYIQASGSLICHVCVIDTDAECCVTLRGCLHQFCVDCVRGTINNSDDTAVKCSEDECGRDPS